MRYAITRDGVVIAVFKEFGHRDYLFVALVAAFGVPHYEKTIVQEVNV